MSLDPDLPGSSCLSDLTDLEKPLKTIQIMQSSTEAHVEEHRAMGEQRQLSNTCCGSISYS